MATTEMERPTREADQDRYRVSVEQYVTFRREGYLIVRGLLPPEDVAAFVRHTDDVLAGREPVPGSHQVIKGWSLDEAERQFNRTSMPHRYHPLHERFLLHPRVLDVLEAIIGPDVMAMQSMLFLKPPGAPGQGYHQDSYYIHMRPDTLVGAWMALERADEENGCLWMTRGSQHEPIHPDPKKLADNVLVNDLDGLHLVENASDPDDTVNQLAPVATKYAGAEVPAVVEAGDVIFFMGHIIHRSHRNASADRFRRSFVGHYGNARSYTEWGGGNATHILARGDTHLPFAQPKFGTSCAATLPAKERARYGSLMVTASDDGMMGMEEMGENQMKPHTH